MPETTNYQGYIIRPAPRPKSQNKTARMQVIDPRDPDKPRAQFRYKQEDGKSLIRAVTQCRQWIDRNPQAEPIEMTLEEYLSITKEQPAAFQKLLFENFHRYNQLKAETRYLANEAELYTALTGRKADDSQWKSSRRKNKPPSGR